MFARSMSLSAVGLALLISANGVMAAGSAKSIRDSVYRSCTTTDASYNIEMMDIYHLKRSKLKAYCSCYADGAARYMGRPDGVAKLSAHTFICMKKIGGYF